MSFIGADATESSSSEPIESFRPDNFLVAERKLLESRSDLRLVQSIDRASSNRFVLRPLLCPAGVTKNKKG